MRHNVAISRITDPINRYGIDALAEKFDIGVIEAIRDDHARFFEGGYRGSRNIPFVVVDGKIPKQEKDASISQAGH